MTNNASHKYKMKIKQLVFLGFLVGLLFSCKKDDNSPKTDPPCETEACELAKLPPVTTTGEGTFACLLNGKAWLSKAGEGTGKSAISGDYYNGITLTKGYLYGFSNQTNEENKLLESISIYTKNYSSKSNNEQTIWNGNSDAYSRYSNFEIDCEYDHNSLSTGQLFWLKFDTINGIMAGTFEFTTYFDSPYTGCDTIRVTHGRFDIDYFRN